MARDKESTEHTITVELSLPESIGDGEYKYEFGVLRRPFRRLESQSYPQEKFCILFLRVAGDTVPSRLVGTFVYSIGNRIVFFPGLVSRNLLSCTGRDKHIGLTVDHVTVEPDLKDWHYTLDDGTQHGTVGHTTMMQKDLTHLFSFSIRSPDELEVTPEEFKMEVRTVDSDSARRLDRFSKATDNLVHLATEPKKDFDGEGVLNFDFFLDRRTNKDSSGYFTRYYSQKEFGDVSPPTETDTCRISEFELDRLDGLIVVKAYWLRGTLAQPSVFWQMPTA